MVRKFDRPIVIRLVLAFIIATVVFAGFFVVSYTVAYKNYQSIASQNNHIQDQIEEMEALLDNLVCSDRFLYEASLKLENVGRRIGILEKRFGKNDERVLAQKEFYNDLEYGHFGIINKLNEECGRDFITVLFFYSNAEELEEESERTGYILDSFKENHPNRVMVYSFDFNSNLGLLRDLKEQYNVTYAPQVVVNKGEAFYLENIDEIDSYIDENREREPGVLYLN